MQILDQRPTGRLRSLFAAALLAAWQGLPAAEIDVAVVDASGHGVAGVGLIAEPQFDLSAARRGTPHTVIMDQKQKQFVPNMLIIQTGTGVDFPNSDQIEHQVYSFSVPKPFQLSLYAGHKYPPIVFDKPGLVVVGCNIHDQMIGYIYVTNSPYFGRSDGAGHWSVRDAPAGNYRITAWHPRMQEPAGTTLQMPLTVTESAAAAAEFKLTKPLRASTTDHGGEQRWVDY
jgi:plastocyanin